MKRQRLAPWCQIRWDGQHLTLLRVRGQQEIYHYDTMLFSSQVTAFLQRDLPVLPWEEWLAQTSRMEEVMELKRWQRQLMKLGLVLESRGAELWSFPKMDWLAPPVDQWRGFSPHAALLADATQGWWLEVPGAGSSLWARTPGELARVLEGEVPAELGAWLTQQAFDGRALPATTLQSSSAQEWLWWESTRFLHRLGPLAHKTPHTQPPLEPPLGKPLALTAPPPEHAARHSLRGHQDRLPMRHEELLGVLAHVFAHTERRQSPWYGEVARLHGPSGGGVYEQSAWVWVNYCQGVARGLYRFDGQERRLVAHALPESMLAQWEIEARRAWGHRGLPQLVVALVADLTLLPQKYALLSQQLTHLNAGFRAAELSAELEAQGFASCVLGGGVMKDLAKLLGINPLLYAPLCELAVAGKAE